MVKKLLKASGLHHGVIALVALIALHFLFPEISFALANALFWFGKELGEATERAGGTGKALGDWSQKKNGGPWEPWDWITPSIAGAIVGLWI